MKKINEGEKTIAQMAKVCQQKLTYFKKIEEETIDLGVAINHLKSINTIRILKIDLKPVEWKYSRGVGRRLLYDE